VVVEIVQLAVIGGLEDDARPFSNGLQALQILDVGVGGGHGWDGTGVLFH
jgi:hypothetical protein